MVLEFARPDTHVARGHSGSHGSRQFPARRLRECHSPAPSSGRTFSRYPHDVVGKGYYYYYSLGTLALRDMFLLRGTMGIQCARLSHVAVQFQ